MFRVSLCVHLPFLGFIAGPCVLSSTEKDETRFLPIVRRCQTLGKILYLLCYLIFKQLGEVEFLNLIFQRRKLGLGWFFLSVTNLESPLSKEKGKGDVSCGSGSCSRLAWEAHNHDKVISQFGASKSETKALALFGVWWRPSS